jgi:hypothetical protein
MFVIEALACGAFFIWYGAGIWFVLRKVVHVSPIAKGLFVIALMCLEAAVAAGFVASWVSFRVHWHSPEDDRRTTDFALDGYAASRPWWRRQRYAVIAYFVTLVVLLLTRGFN